MLYNAEKQCIDVNQRRFHGNKPSVRQVAFTVQQGELSVTAGTKLKGDYTRLSGGGNGDVRFHNITPGVYAVDGVLADNKGNTTRYLVIINDDEADDGVAEFEIKDIEQAATVAGFDFEHEREAQKRVLERLREAATYIQGEIQKERQAHAEEVIDNITATPEFEVLPTHTDIVAAMQREAFDDNAYIVKNGTPKHYIVTRPLFAKASTAQEVVDAAKERVEARQRAEKEAKEAATELALPALSGTPRQIAWAMQIRAEHAQHHPDATNLKRATTAKYWIDNRDKLGEKTPRRQRV